jgi:hypothetical protein
MEIFVTFRENGWGMEKLVTISLYRMDLNWN